MWKSLLKKRKAWTVTATGCRTCRNGVLYTFSWHVKTKQQLRQMQTLLLCNGMTFFSQTTLTFLHLSLKIPQTCCSCPLPFLSFSEQMFSLWVNTHLITCWYFATDMLFHLHLPLYMSIYMINVIYLDYKTRPELANNWKHTVKTGFINHLFTEIIWFCGGKKHKLTCCWVLGWLCGCQ